MAAKSILEEWAETLADAERLRNRIIEEFESAREFERRAGWTARLPGALGQVVRGALVEEPPPLWDLGSIVPWTVGASLGFYLTAQTGGALGVLLGWNRIYKALKGLRYTERLLGSPSVLRTLKGVAVASGQSLLGRMFVGRPEEALEKAAQDGAFVAVLGVTGEYVFSPLLRRVLGRTSPPPRPALPPPRPSPPRTTQLSLFEGITPPTPRPPFPEEVTERLPVIAEQLPLFPGGVRTPLRAPLPSEAPRGIYGQNLGGLEGGYTPGVVGPAEEGLRLFEQTLKAFESAPAPRRPAGGLGIVGSELAGLFEEYAAGKKNVSFSNLFRKKEFLQKYAERIQKRLQSEFTEGDASNAIGRLVAELETGFAFTRSEFEDLRRVRAAFARGKTSMPLKELVDLWGREPEALAAVAFGHPGWLPVRMPRQYRDIIELKALDKVAERVIAGGMRSFEEAEPTGSILYNLGRSVLEDLKGELAKNPNTRWRLDTFQRYVKRKVLEKLGLQGAEHRVAISEAGQVVSARVPLNEGASVVAPELQDRLEVMAAVVGKMTGRSADDVLKEVMTALAGSDERYIADGLRQLSVSDAYQALLMMESMIPQDKVSVVKELLDVAKYWGRMSSEPIVGFLEFLERNPEEYARVFLKQPHVSEVKTLTIGALEGLGEAVSIETPPVRVRVPVRDPSIRGLQREPPETLGEIVASAEKIRRETRKVTEKTPSNLLEAARKLVGRVKDATPETVEELVAKVPRSSSEIARFKRVKKQAETMVLGRPPGAVGDASTDEEVALWKLAVKAIADFDVRRGLASDARELYTRYMDDVVNNLLEVLPESVRTKLGRNPTLWEIVRATKADPNLRRRYVRLKTTLMRQFVEMLSKREGSSMGR